MRGAHRTGSYASLSLSIFPPAWLPGVEWVFRKEMPMEEYKLANDEIHAPQELKETVLAGLPHSPQNILENTL